MTKTEILDAVNALLVEKWPERTVYVDDCPVDFARPSLGLAVERYDLTDANRAFLKHDLQLSLTIYGELDEHSEASGYRLSKEADEAVGLLSRVLKVGSRHLKPQLKVLPRGYDRVCVLINLSWMDNRPGLAGSREAPVADSYALRVRGGTT